MEPPHKDKDEEPLFEGSLDEEGKLVRQPGAGGPPSRPARAPPRRVQPLELVERPPRPETDYVPPPAPPKPSLPSRVPAALWPLLLLCAALGAGGWYLFLRETPGPKGTPAAVVVLITSEPSGASVSVEGTPVGVTPWAADNTWVAGPVAVTLTHPGYRPWSGTFQGGRPARLEAKLQRR